MSVFLFHIGMIFNNWDWHIKNNVTAGHRSALWYIMVFLHTWRMPLLILISGAGTYFALGRRTSWQYLKERFTRLFIPLAIGIFTLVPVQVYIEKQEQYGSLPAYYPHMFDGIYPSGNFSWHHLWFIAYLFFIALIISPFLGFFRSGRFDLFVDRLAGIVTKRFGANVFVLPLLVSQVTLRPFFPDNTHALVNDWAAVSYFLLFFLSGFIIISNPRFTESIRRQKWLFLAEALITSTLLVTVPSMIPGKAGGVLWDLLEPVVAFSCGLAALGFARQYLTRNNKLRKLANEAIYPFYLLHQPVIVVTGSYIVEWPLGVAWKAILITLLSFALTVAFYWYVVRPFNVMRVVFGMKPRTRQRKATARKVEPVWAVEGIKRTG